MPAIDPPFAGAHKNLITGLAFAKSMGYVELARVQNEQPC